MGKIDKALVQEVVNAFDTKYEYVGALPYGSGHINDTFVAHYQPEEGDCKRYIFQRINTSVFKNPAELMENIQNVTEYLKKEIIAAGGNPDRETLQLIYTKDGQKNYYTDQFGGCWRAYDFVEDTVTLQQAQTALDFYHSAVAFGNFQRVLAGYPAQTLHETIVNFHNTRARFDNFTKALQADALGRAKDVQAEIAFVQAHEADTSVLVDLLEIGALPLRVTHNDTKLNNVLLDRDSGEAICVIDLDTVMPGLAAYDFGDSIRFGASSAAEDERDLSKVWMDLSLFEAFTKGYMETAGQALTEKEIDTLPWGAKLMTLECGMRFLTDYLEGDTYFKTHREGHNLDRARTQFKLVADMESKWDDMAKVIEKYKG